MSRCSKQEWLSKECEFIICTVVIITDCFSILLAGNIDRKWKLIFLYDLCSNYKLYIILPKVYKEKSACNVVIIKYIIYRWY